MQELKSKYFLLTWCGDGEACEGWGDGLGAWLGLLLGGGPPCCVWWGDAGGRGWPPGPGLGAGDEPPGQGRFGSGYCKNYNKKKNFFFSISNN